MTREKAKEIISYHKILVDRDKSGLLDKQLEYQAIDMAIKALEQEPKKGHWIYLKHNKAKCSECDDVVLIAQTYGNANYCPNCGAKMAESEKYVNFADDLIPIMDEAESEK